MKFSAIGTYDTLNPFVIKGVPAAGIGMIFDTLMTQSQDEPGSEYGLVAERAVLAPDRLSVLYTLRPGARFHDGSPITPADVVWTFDTLRAKGQPMYRSYYGDVTKVAAEGERGVRFTFASADNRELPVILGEMPVLSQKYWSSRDFTKTTLDSPLGSGPYKVAAVDPGRAITYKRVADYWGADLPVNKGRYNVDTIRYDYYRDGTIALEAFKAGQYDIRRENSSKNWATGYDSPALRDGLIKKEQIPNKLPSGMQGFGYNLRRPMFQDPRVREALAYAFDFEWSNKNLFYGLYTRTRSYFDNSGLAATGIPTGEELKILEPFRGKIPDAVFTKEYDPPKYDAKFTLRDGLREAVTLLREAGWTFKNEQLVNAKTGQPFTFEILLGDPQMERIVLPFAQNLKRIGITARVRTVDTAQYEKRMETFDYRHGGGGVRRVAVAGQRAARILGLAGGRPAGQPQPARHQEPGRRPPDRRADRRPRPREPRRPYSCARPGVAVWLLRDPQFPQHRVLGGVLGQVPPPEGVARLRHRLRHLVGRPDGRAGDRGEEGRGDEVMRTAR